MRESEGRKRKAFLPESDRSSCRDAGYSQRYPFLSLALYSSLWGFLTPLFFDLRNLTKVEENVIPKVEPLKLHTGKREEKIYACRCLSVSGFKSRSSN